MRHETIGIKPPPPPEGGENGETLIVFSYCTVDGQFLRMRHLLLLRLPQPIALTRRRPLFRLGMGSEDVMRNCDTQKINLLFSILYSL